MSVDVATLVFDFQSDSALTAEKRMDALIEKGKQVEGVSKQVRTATDRMNDGFNGAAGSAQKATQGAMAYTQAMGATQKADRDAERSAAQLLSFRQRMWKQQGAEALASAKAQEAAQTAADRASERSAAQVLAFRQRMARQRAAAEGEEAKRAAMAVAAADRELDARIASAMRGQVGFNAAMVGGTRSAKGLQLAALDLSRQFADIGVTAAMGMNPLMILIQQGPQIADRFALMKQEGIGLSSALKSLGVSLGLIRTTLPPAVAEAGALAVAEQAAAATALEAAVATRAAAKGAEEQAAANTAAAAAATRLAAANTAVAETATAAAVAEGVALAPLGAILAGLATAAVILGGGLALATRALKKDFGDLTKGMGLTEAQLERVKNKGVTMGDVLKGTFNYVVKALGPTFKPLADFFSNLFDNITKGAVSTIKLLVGGFLGAFNAITAVWKMLPAAIGDAVISAANLAIGAVEKLINGAIALFNKLRPAINALAHVQGIFVDVPEIQPVQIDRLKNDYAGAMKNVGQAASKGFAEGMAEGGAFVDRQLAGIKDSIKAAAQDRIKKEAGKAGRGAATPRNMDDERAAQIAEMLAQARAAELQSQIELSRDVLERARLQKEVVKQELAEQQAKVLRAAASIADDKGLSAAKKLALIGQLEEVKAINARVATAKARAIDDAAADAKAKEGLDLANAHRDSDVALLQSQLALATTAKARGDIEMRLLRLADERARAEAQAVIDSKTASDNQKAIAEETIRSLAATRANREEAQNRATNIAGAEEIIRELQLVDGLAQSAGQSLESAFGRAGGALGRMVSSLADLRVQMAQIDRDVMKGDLTTAQGARERSALQIRSYGDKHQDHHPARPGHPVRPAEARRHPLRRHRGGDLSGDADRDEEEILRLHLLRQDQDQHLDAIARPGPGQPTDPAGGLAARWCRSAATALGVDGAKAVLDSFQVNLGKLSFKDLSGEEIQAQIEAVFSKLGDDLSAAVIPSITQFQKVGEGAFETLVRVAKEYQVTTSPCSRSARPSARSAWPRSPRATSW
jgi:hypothetical protein